jgi:hypothetical protein
VNGEDFCYVRREFKTEDENDDDDEDDWFRKRPIFTALKAEGGG